MQVLLINEYKTIILSLPAEYNERTGCFAISKVFLSQFSAIKRTEGENDSE